MKVVKGAQSAGKRSVAREDVIWCYQTLLKREPESEEVVKLHIQRNSNFRDLVLSFIACEEFHRAPVSAARLFHPLPLPDARIDVRVDARQLAAAIAKVKAAWSHLGNVRPHHSVLTNDVYLPQNLPGSIHHFWASGETEASQVAGILQSHGVAPQGKVCVEYGCGVGRVTSGLAKHFDQVHAYDISPGHLAEAKSRIEAVGLKGVTFVLCSESFLEDLQPCDAFYSRIVFQHNPPPLIDALVRSALKALKPGGIAIFQVPTYAAGYSFDFEQWSRSKGPLDMEMHCLPQRYIFQAIGEAGCVALEVREDGSTGDENFISNTFVVRKPLE